MITRNDLVLYSVCLAAMLGLTGAIFHGREPQHLYTPAALALLTAAAAVTVGVCLWALIGAATGELKRRHGNR